MIAAGRIAGHEPCRRYLYHRFRSRKIGKDCAGRAARPLRRQGHTRRDCRDEMHGTSLFLHLDFLHFLVSPGQLCATQGGLAHVLVDVIAGSEQQLAFAGAQQ